MCKHMHRDADVIYLILYIQCLDLPMSFGNLCRSVAVSFTYTPIPSFTQYSKTNLSRLKNNNKKSYCGYSFLQLLRMFCFKYHALTAICCHTTY